MDPLYCMFTQESRFLFLMPTEMCVATFEKVQRSRRRFHGDFLPEALLFVVFDL